MRTDRACVTTRLAGVRHVWGPGDHPRVYRLCGETPPRILSARLMVSLSVHVSSFDLYIVYTNMSGVTLLPPVACPARDILCFLPKNLFRHHQATCCHGERDRPRVRLPACPPRRVGHRAPTVFHPAGIRPGRHCYAIHCPARSRPGRCPPWDHRHHAVTWMTCSYFRIISSTNVVRPVVDRNSSVG